MQSESDNVSIISEFHG